MRSLVIEGYASLFGLKDMAGDEVRAGAFSRSLAGGGPVEMLSRACRRADSGGMDDTAGVRARVVDAWIDCQRDRSGAEGA